MSHAYQVPLFARLSRVFLRPIFRGVFRILGKVELEGIENIPSDGAYLIVFNHVSIYDPPFVVAFWPKPPEVLGAVDVWSRPGQNILALLYGGIPIHRGEVDRVAMEKMVSVLRNGSPLLVAPEGGRSHHPGLRLGKPGTAYLVDKTQVPIVPVGVIGTTDDFFKRAIRGEKPLLRMVIGPSFHVPEIEEPQLSPKETRQRKVDYLMGRIASLLPPNYRGVYAHLQTHPESPIRAR